MDSVKQWDFDGADAQKSNHTNLAIERWIRVGRMIATVLEWQRPKLESVFVFVFVFATQYKYKNARKSTGRCANKTAETVETIQIVETVETVLIEDLKKYRLLTY